LIFRGRIIPWCDKIEEGSLTLSPFSF
jgi:hypothetical protein